MRTSTTLFLVIFLGLFSSSEHRHELKAFAHDVKQTVREFAQRRCSNYDHHDSRARSESEETRDLRQQLNDVEKRGSLAKKSLRTIDRAIRSIEERIRSVENEMGRDPSFPGIYEVNLTSLRGQVDQMERERDEIMAMREVLKSTEVALQSKIDLASIRDERREVEAFLDRERLSPVDHLLREAESRR